MDNLIDFWSYSSMTALLRNPLAFKKKYILKVYDDIDSPSAVVGKAAHKALEAYYNGKEQSDAIQVGLDLINHTSDMGINYGKTGSRANIISTYTQAVNFYFQELPVFHEILGVELEAVEEIETIDGQKLSLPAKSFSDLVVRNKLGEIEIIDHKFVRSYSDSAVDNFGHFIQAMFNYHTLKAKLGEAPKRMIFNECKVSKNKDSTPQIQPYVVEFDGEGSIADFATFYNLYDACTRLINLEGMVFLPNPNDIFDGQVTFETFRNGTLGVDRPTTVKHKTEQVQFAEKKYVPSTFDKLENQDLTDEERIRLKLQEFGISVEMQDTHVGASVTQYTFKPSKGVAMSKISKLTNDLAIALKVHSLRISAPIRGTDMVGVEIPSAVRKTIELGEQHFKPNTLRIPIGVDVFGTVHYKDLADMPHLLIAGASGSGKSVMLNVLLTALTKQMKPEAMQLILIDPKRVELSQFSRVPHLVQPIVFNDQEATEVLRFAVEEMERRYGLLSEVGARRIEDFDGGLPRIVIVIDEFADLMMTGGSKKHKQIVDIFEGETESMPSAQDYIIRIAQKARAVGIHLVLATQRPSADVVTGLIRANLPTKICFMVSSAVNSRIVLDQTGAEELTGKGDLLLSDPSKSGLQRLQGLYA
jgi:hypothetical protein